VLQIRAFVVSFSTLSLRQIKLMMGATLTNLPIPNLAQNGMMV